MVTSDPFNTFAAGIRIYRTWKSAKNRAYLMCFSNGIAPQRIALASCSSPQNTQQVFEPAMKKNYDFGFRFVW